MHAAFGRIPSSNNNIITVQTRMVVDCELCHAEGWVCVERCGRCFSAFGALSNIS